MSRRFRASALRLLRQIQRETRKDIITATPFMGDDELILHILQSALALEEESRYRLLDQAKAELLFATEQKVSGR